LVPRNRLPGKSLRTADSPEGSVCGCIGGAGPFGSRSRRPRSVPSDAGPPRLATTMKAWSRWKVRGRTMR